MDSPLPSFPAFLGDKTTLWTVPRASSTSSPGTYTTAPSRNVFQETQSVTSSSNSQGYYPVPTPPSTLQDDNNDGFLDGLEGRTKAAMGVAITIGVLIIIVLSVWYCCGCCGLRAKRRKRLEGQRAPPINHQSPMPLRPMHPGDVGPRDAPPPLYEEAVPPQHRHIAGGATHVREEEEGIISDGKTPLSEIPFEDVVLDHSPSEGSSRSFGERHHGLGGDTRGHTNS